MKKIFIFALTAVLALTVSCGGTKSETPYELGERYLDLMDYEEAIISFRAAIEIDPKNIDAYIGLAKAYEALGKTEEALSALSIGVSATGSERLSALVEAVKAGASVYDMADGEKETPTSDLTETEAPPFDENEPIVINDEVLENILREEIGKPEGDILQSDLDSIESLVIERGAVDISALARLRNLKYLFIYRSPQIKDYSPLWGLSRLETLEVSRCGLTDLSSFAKLTNLRVLMLSGNYISDITPLKGLTGLVWLDLSSNGLSEEHEPLKDISPLAGLTGLTDLFLGSNQIEDISALSGMTQMQHLEIYWTDISDVTPLAGMKKLESLDINGTKVTDISALSGLNKLQQLNVSHTDINDISALSELKELKSLNLEWTDVTDISVLAGLDKLEYVDLMDTSVEDFSPVEHVENVSGRP